MRPFRSIRSPPCGSVAGRCLLAFLGTISLAHAATPARPRSGRCSRIGRLGIESAEEMWPAADAQGRGVLVGVRADRVVFTLAFDDQGRLDRLDGGRLASKFEWTELPTSGCLPVSVSSTTASPWSPPSRGDGE